MVGHGLNARVPGTCPEKLDGNPRDERHLPTSPLSRREPPMSRFPVRLAAALIAVCCCWFTSPALGQGPPTQARKPAAPAQPKPPTPPYVTVTKADGTQVKGLLIASDPVGVTLRAPSP